MEEAYIYSNHSKIHESSVATSNPNKNGFSSPLSWRAQAYKMENGRERDTKRKMELFPQALALLQALQIAFLLLQNVGHFSDDCPQLCQIVAIGHDGNERRNQTNGKENDLNKSVGIQRTGTEQQTSNGKNCDHSCRENGHGETEIDIAPPHPFHIAGSTLFSGNYELFV